MMACGVKHVIQNDLKNLLKISPEQEKERIINFIKKSVKKLGRDGVVFGLSGGLDSTVVAYLVKEAFPKKSLALLLPEEYNEEVEDAEEVVKSLGIPYKKIILQPILKELGKYDMLSRLVSVPIIARSGLFIMKRLAGRKMLYSMNPEEIKSGNKIISRLIGTATVCGILKWRTRMILLYKYALINNYAVLGTTNRTEYILGHYDPYGDGAVDIECIVHLYKTQVFQLAKYLNIPDKIINKRPYPDWLPGIFDIDLIGMKYEKVDTILALMERGLSEKEIESYGFPKEIIEEIRESISLAIKRRSPPLSLLRE